MKFLLSIPGTRSIKSTSLAARLVGLIFAISLLVLLIFSSRLWTASYLMKEGWIENDRLTALDHWLWDSYEIPSPFSISFDSYSAGEMTWFHAMVVRGWPAKYVREFDLERSGLTDTEFRALGPMPEAEVLILGRNQLTDEVIPMIFRHAPDVRILDLSGTQITGHQHFEHFAKLNSSIKGIDILDFTDTKIDDIGLANLLKAAPNLNELILEGTLITDQSGKTLKGFKNCTFFQLGRTKITEETLAKLNTAKFRQIHVGDSQVNPRDWIASARGFKSLGSVDVSGLPFTDNDLELLIKKAPNLTILNVEGSSVTDAGIAQLESLKAFHQLNLRGTEVTTACFETLRKLPRLQYVFIDPELEDTPEWKSLKAANNLYTW